MAFASLSQQRASAAIIPGDPFFLDRLGQIVALEARYVLPTVYEGPEFPMSGGLMNYGASFLGAFGDLATYTGRILKRARPEDLPVEQTTKFEMVINLKTAGAGVDTRCNGRHDGVGIRSRVRRHLSIHHSRNDLDCVRNSRIGSDADATGAYLLASSAAQPSRVSRSNAPATTIDVHMVLSTKTRS